MGSRSLWSTESGVHSAYINVAAVIVTRTHFVVRVSEPYGMHYLFALFVKNTLKSVLLTSNVLFLGRSSRKPLPF
jgi:hypothetical protein